MPPKKAEKVPRRARARARERSPQRGAGLKVVGAGLVLSALVAGWLVTLGDDGSEQAAVPYSAGGVTAITGGGRDVDLPSSRAAVPVPFGPSTLVTLDQGLVTTTTAPDGTVTTTSLTTIAPRLYSISWWTQLPSTTRPPGRREPGTSSTTRPHPTHPSTSSSTTTTRPTTTTTRPTTTTTESTTTTTEGTTTTSTTEPTTTTTEGSTTTSTTEDASTTTSP